MKVVLCTPEFYPINGGVSNAIQNFAELLSRYGFDTYVVTPLIRNFKKFEIKSSIVIKRIKPILGLDPYRTLGKFLFAFQAALYIRSLNPDVVIGETTGILGGFVSGLVNNKRIKTFIRGHGSELHNYFTNYSGVRKVFFRFMLNLNDLVLATNKNHYFMLSKMTNNKKVRYLYNYIPTSFRKKKKNLNSTLKLLSVSRLIKIKGIQYCLLALTETNLDYEYTIVGEGEYKSELETIVKEKKIKNVKFIGKVPNYKVIDLMEESDILIFLSTREGLSMTMLEALANGLPIIATDVGGAKNFIKQNITGYKVEPKSVEDVINALNYISKNRKILTEYSKNSISLINKYFGEKAIINRFKKLIREI